MNSGRVLESGADDIGFCQMLGISSRGHAVDCFLGSILAEAMPPASTLDRHARFGFAQQANDLFLGRALLHVQSPRSKELDSKLRRYSNLGGCWLLISSLLCVLAMAATFKQANESDHCRTNAA